MLNIIPIITVDGPSGSGKGTLASRLAKSLSWHFLDSGALYRVLAYAAQETGIQLDNVSALTAQARHLPVHFEEKSDGRTGVFWQSIDITTAIRTEICGNAASQVAQYAPVREALLERQRAFAQAPGLVADGRDMGTVVFPEAPLKLYLEASPEIRAKRRFLQLQAAGLDANLGCLLEEIQARDIRDKNRTVCPLKPASDAVVVDTTELDAEMVFHIVEKHVQRCFGALFS